MVEEMPLRCNNSGKGVIELMTKEVIDKKEEMTLFLEFLTLLGRSLGQVRTLTL